MMNDFTNNSFEEQWQKAFEDASLTPSDDVWDKIEQGLSIEAAPATPQVPKNTFPFYYIGTVLVTLLGIGYWVFIANTDITKDIEPAVQEQIKLEKQILVKSPTPTINEKEVRKIQPLDPQLPVKAKPLPIELSEEQPLENLPEEPIERTKLADSIETITPLSTKNTNHAWQQPNIVVPVETTPYYEPAKPKPPKKSIFKNVKVSVGVGTYQQ